MQGTGFLSPTVAVLLLIISLLSGGLAVIREVQLMYAPAKAGDRKVFWGFVRIAFVIAAVLLWSDERAKVGQLESRLLESHGHIYFDPQVAIHLDPSNPVWPFKVGDAPIAAVGVTNQGHQYITIERAGKFGLAPLSSLQNESVFREFLRNPKYGKLLTMPPNPLFHLYSTYDAEKLTAKDIDNLQRGTAGLGIMGVAKWKDDTGCYTSEYFEYQSAEEGSIGWSWHSGSSNFMETSSPCPKTTLKH